MGASPKETEEDLKGEQCGMSISGKTLLDESSFVVSHD
jgi:hypothetical protein